MARACACCVFQLYHGPRQALPAYLTDLGFQVPNSVEVVRGGPVASILPASLPVSSGRVNDVDLAAKDDQEELDVKEDFADFLSGFLFMPHRGLPAGGCVGRKNSFFSSLSSEFMIHFILSLSDSSSGVCIPGRRLEVSSLVSRDV